VKTCSSSCSSWLHPLRSWSLRQTRGGSFRDSAIRRASALVANHRRFAILSDTRHPIGAQIFLDRLRRLSGLGVGSPRDGLAKSSGIGESHWSIRPIVNRRSSLPLAACVASRDHSALPKSTEATDCRVADVIRSSDVRKNLSSLTTSYSFPTLMTRQLWLSAQNDSPCFRALPTSPVRVRISSRSNSARPARDAVSATMSAWYAKATRSALGSASTPVGAAVPACLAPPAIPAMKKRPRTCLWLRQRRKCGGALTCGL
jgi:hypothetical protein